MTSFYSRTTRKNAWSTIFVQKPCFGGVSTGVEKQTQMMVVRPNGVSTIMHKNAKLSYKNYKLQLAAPETYLATLV